MKVVVAVDSFKGSVTSGEAGDAVRLGVLDADPAATVSVVPIADGGEGTLDVLVDAHGGQRIAAPGRDALGRPVDGVVGRYVRDGTTVCVVESARTIGLDLVAVDRSLPSAASSDGLGLHLRCALEAGADEVLVTLGGTASTDGGTGLFRALGARFFDAGGDEIVGRENPLWRLASADLGPVARLEGVTVLCDVTNPLLGPDGATTTFGPQKGASPDAVRHLEQQMARWAQIVEGWCGSAVGDEPGAGAAGGLGAAFLALGSRLTPGFARVADEVGLPALVAEADLVVTGEGRLDGQTARGKVTSGVAALARRDGALVVALAGQVDVASSALEGLLDGAFAIHRRPITLSEAMTTTATTTGLRETAAEVTRLVAASRASSQRSAARSSPR